MLSTTIRTGTITKSHLSRQRRGYAGKKSLQIFFFFLLVTQICFAQLPKHNPIQTQPNQSHRTDFGNSNPTHLTDSKFSKTNQNPNWVQYYGNYDNPVNTSYNSVALDDNGNIYAFGTTEKAFPRVDVSLSSCYNKDGNLQWIVEGKNLFIDWISFDSTGNIYAQGRDSIGGCIIKYNQQWIEQWRIYDGGYFTKIDSKGNIFITTSRELGSYDKSEILTKKYNNTGELDWEKQYRWVGGSINYPTKLEVDNTGEIIVFGESYTPDGSCQTSTMVKYSNDGTEISNLGFAGSAECWMKQYAIDDSGSFYIAVPRGGSPNFITNLYKYGNSGTLQWTATTNGFPRGLVPDENENVYVITQADEWKIIQYTTNGVLKWSKKTESAAQLISIDENKNVYIAGTVDSLGQSRIVIVKYNNQGNESWTYKYSDRSSSTSLNDFKINSKFESVIVGNNDDAEGIIIKLNSNGAQEWLARYEGVKYPNDHALDMGIDSQQNIYISGRSGPDYSRGILFKYDQIGNLQWTKEIFSVRPFVLPIMKITGDGSIYYSYSTSSEEEENVRFLYLMNYDSDGKLNWEYEYKSSSGIWQLDPVQILVDNSGNAYIFSNRSGPNLESTILFHKFSKLGDLIWTKEISDMQIAGKETLSIDRNNQIYFSTNGNNDGVINFMKYNELGELVWIREFDPGPNGWCSPRNVFLDENGYEYIIGIYHDTGNEKLLTIKYDSLGNQKWFNILGANSTIPLAINVDNNGDVFVSCLISDSNWSDTFGLIKYDKGGKEQWIYKEYLGYSSNTFDTEFDTYGNAYFVNSNGTMIISKYSKEGVLVWREQYVNSKWNFLWESPQKIIIDKADRLNIVGTSQQWMYGFNAHWVASSIITILQYDISVTNVENTNSNVRSRFNLSQNYPNPFNPSTVIKYTIPSVETQHAVSVQLKVYDILGNEVKILINKEMEAGYHSVDFNASELPSGVYFYRLKAGNFLETKKMILLR
jgi:hypothetical protein